MSGEASISMNRVFYKLRITDLISYMMDDGDSDADFDESQEEAYQQELEELVPEIDGLMDSFYADNEDVLDNYEDVQLLPELSFVAVELSEMAATQELLPLPQGFDRAYLCVRFLLLEEYNKRCLEIVVLQTGTLPLASLAKLAMDVDQVLERYLKERKEEPLH